MTKLHKNCRYFATTVPQAIQQQPGAGTFSPATAPAKKSGSGSTTLLSTLRFSTLFHNDPSAHQDHCGRCRIRTRDLCPRSLVRYHHQIVETWGGRSKRQRLRNTAWLALVFFSSEKDKAKIFLKNYDNVTSGNNFWPYDNNLYNTCVIF